MLEVLAAMKGWNNLLEMAFQV